MLRTVLPVDEFFLFFHNVFPLSFSNEIKVDDDDDSFAGLAFVGGSFSGVFVTVGVFRGDFSPNPLLSGSTHSLYWGVSSLGILFFSGIVTVVTAAVVVVVVVISGGDVVLVVF